MDPELAEVVSHIRACIITLKGSVSIQSLMRDYKTLIGGEIPYRKFNYPTLESFLKSLSSLRVIGSGRDALVEAATNQSSSHISSLVAKQRPAKKKDSYPAFARRGYPPTRGRARGYPPRNYVQRDYSTARRYQPSTSQAPPYKREVSNSSSERVEPLVVKIQGNDKRQVSVGENYTSHKQPSHPQKENRPKYELPPRLQKNNQNAEASLNPPALQKSTIDISKRLEDNLYLNEGFRDNSLSEATKSQAIISALGPGQCVAAGRAKQVVAHFDNLMLQEPFHDGSLQELGHYDNLMLQDPFHDESLVQRAGFSDRGLDNLPDNLLMSPVPLPDENNVVNNMTLLQEYSLTRNWCMPEFIVVKTKGSSKQMGSVKINAPGEFTKKYSSYPFVDENPEVVYGYAAKKALEELHEEAKVKLEKKLISTDKTIICDRISNMVADSPYGMFAKKVGDQYLEKYNEGLPEDWISLVNSCPTMSVESSLNSIIIVPRDPSLDQIFHDPIPFPEPLPLELPPADVWDVYVTHATSTDSVWFRLIGENYSEKYEVLLTNMDDYYCFNGDKELALSIDEGHYYAAKSLEGWFRVCVTNVKENSKAVNAWLIDHGDDDIFSFRNLYRLTPEFCQLPIQAIRCTLEGLENFSDFQITSEVIGTCEDLIGKSLIAQITHRDEETRFLKVLLYDTSGSDDINLNDIIRDSIIMKSDPILPNEGCVLEVFISHISKRGEIYIQMPGPAYERISEMLEDLGTEEISKHKLTSYRQVVLKKVYLAKYSKDDSWYRAVVTATPSVQQNKIAVRFVDFGNAETVSITDIADVENLPLIISRLPHQSIKVALNNLPIETLHNTDVAKLHSLLMDEEEKVVLIKTIKLQEDPPLVEIFYKNDSDDSALISVNETIAQHQKFQRHEDKNLHSFDISSYKSYMKNYTNGRDKFCPDLKRPEFDEDFMGVFVVLAANPGNFMFQPSKYAKEFKTFRGRLQAYYEATALPEILKGEVVKGGLYAARYIDDVWYRVVVTEAVIGTKVAVRFCDYGDLTCVPLSNLRELEPEFWQVPFMAVKGKLAGVVPIHTDWSVEDCIRFQNLVVNKMLAAKVVSIEDNFVNPMEMVVSLNLTDTNSDQDEIIAEILVHENRAVKEKS